MASTRAAEVAEILWELKRADKVATYTEIAGRAGFSAGSNGRTMIGCIDRVKKDWPHLQWWRAINDEGLVDEGSEHASKLVESGYNLEPVDEGKVTLAEIDVHLMSWNGHAEEAAEEEE